MKFFLRLLAVLLALPMIGYSLGVTALLAARMLRGETFMPVAAFNTLLPGALFPGALFLLAALLYRGQTRLRLALLQLPAVIALVILYGGAFLPKTTAVPAEAARLSVLTFNVNPANSDSAAVSALIDEADADVVALQALNAGMALELGRALADDYPHQVFDRRSRWAGKGLLSRYPLHAADIWHSPGAVGQQRVLLDVNGTAIALYNLELPQPFAAERLRYNGAARYAAVRAALERAAQESAPVILAGTFNLSDQTYDYWHITRQYNDAYQTSGFGFGFTFPGGTFYSSWLGWTPPLTRFDYVFYSADFASAGAQVWRAAGSDHYPLRVELALR